MAKKKLEKKKVIVDKVKKEVRLEEPKKPRFFESVKLKPTIVKAHKITAEDRIVKQFGGDLTYRLGRTYFKCSHKPVIGDYVTLGGEYIAGSAVDNTGK